MDVVLAHPPEFKLMPEEMRKAEENAKQAGVKFEVVDNMEDAFKDVDVVYPKSWGCIDLFENPEESLELAKKYKDWICNDQLMKLVKEDSIYMHCLPADRGNEAAAHRI